MTTKITSYAKAAQHLPMPWLAPTDFPARNIVKESFKDAIGELLASDSYDDNLVRSALEAIGSGTDPRGAPSKPRPSRPQPSCTTVSPHWRWLTCRTDMAPVSGEDVEKLVL